MSDCPNDEIRDLLPDLLRDDFAAAERARVEAHLATCVDCTDEVALLRASRRALGVGVPAVNVPGIVRALPAPQAGPGHAERVVPIGAAPSARARRRFASWRRAAAVAALAAGVTAVVILNDGRAGRGDRTVSADSAAVARHDDIGPADSRTGSSVLASSSAAARRDAARDAGRDTRDTGAARDAGLSMAGGVSDLSDDAIVALLGGIDDIDSAPATEPAGVMPEMTGEGTE